MAHWARTTHEYFIGILHTKRMADKELDTPKKRGHREVSSVSDLDSSINTPPAKKNDNTRKAKKEKNENSGKENEKTMKSIQLELNQINKKLENVMTKDDGSLRETIKCMIKQMKDELLQSVEHKIEVLESKLFNKEKDNDQLKEQIKKLNIKLETKTEENERMKWNLEKVENDTTEWLNNIEQYSRSNNIRINGIEEGEKETTETTTNLVISKLNEQIPNLNLQARDIDIAHRLGKKIPRKRRQIIVKLVSRTTRNTIMRNVGKFKGTKIFLSEDLTKLNNYVYNCIKNKMTSDILATWTRSGSIFYESASGRIHKVLYRQYQNWIDLPWPQNKESDNTGTCGTD